MRWNNKKDPLDYGFEDKKDNTFVWYDSLGSSRITINKDTTIDVLIISLNITANVSHETLNKLYNLIKEGVLNESL